MRSVQKEMRMLHTQHARAGAPLAERHLYHTGKAERTAHVVCDSGPHRDRGGYTEAMRETDRPGGP